jgi:hypothetical protein
MFGKSRMREVNKKRNWAAEVRSVPLKEPVPASSPVEWERYFDLAE